MRLALVPPGNRFEPNLEKMHESIEFLIEKVDFGVVAHFAKRVGHHIGRSPAGVRICRLGSGVFF